MFSVCLLSQVLGEVGLARAMKDTLTILEQACETLNWADGHPSLNVMSATRVPFSHPPLPWPSFAE